MCYHKQSSHQVVINEAIELCKDFVDDSSHGLVNSVLQKLYDEIQNPEKASLEKPKKNTTDSSESTSLEETTG